MTDVVLIRRALPERKSLIQGFLEPMTQIESTFVTDEARTGRPASPGLSEKIAQRIEKRSVVTHRHERKHLKFCRD